MNVYLVSFRLANDYGIYTMVVVAHNYDEAETNAQIFEPNYEIGSVELIDPSHFSECTIVRTVRYIE